MLQVYFDRKFSGLIGVASLLLVVSGGFGLTKGGNSLPAVVQIVGWLVIAAMVWGVIVGFRQMWKPPLMFTADRRGVMIYYDAERVRFTDNGVFLPWMLVTGMQLEERTVPGGISSNVKKTWVIACTLKDNAPFSVKQHSVAYNPKDGERVACLDAFVGTVARQELLDRLRPLWQAALNGK